MSIQQILLPPILHPLPRRLLPGASEYSSFLAEWRLTALAWGCQSSVASSMY